MTHRLIIVSADLSESKLPGRIDDARMRPEKEKNARDRRELLPAGRRIKKPVGPESGNR